MSHSTERERPRSTVATVVGEGPGGRGDELLCTCCVPANPLVLRPDLGVRPDGLAEWALCVFHVPEPSVYRVRDDGSYELAPGLRLDELGELVDPQGAVVARVQQDGFQRLTTVDDDAPPEPGRGGGGAAAPLTGGGERPAYSHTRIDLTQDEFYRTAGR